MKNINKQKHNGIKILIFAGLSLASLYTQAAPVLCSAGSPHPDGLLVTDITFESAVANDCYGVVQGNDDGNTIWTTTGWTLLAKDNTPDGLDQDDLTGTVNGIDFTLDATPEAGATSGDWTLSWTETGSPGYNLTMDVIAVLKASDRFASYLFDDLMFTSNDSGSGTWKISYLKGDNYPNLSHLSLYYKDPTHTNGGGGGGQGNAPEPNVFALFGMGLMGMGLSHIRRKRKTH